MFKKCLYILNVQGIIYNTLPVFYYGFDSLYLYLVVPAIIIALWSQIKVKTTFSKYSAYRTDISGADAARKVLEASGVYGVKIERVSGNLTDHYDPKTNVIRLSDSVYSSYNVSAVGVAAHEAGQAPRRGWRLGRHTLPPRSISA